LEGGSELVEELVEELLEGAEKKLDIMLLLCFTLLVL
jgi:hypothetical protein